MTPEVDPVAIGQYVALVFGYLEGFVPVRALAEAGTTDCKPYSDFHRPEDLADALFRLAPRAADQFRGLYVVPCTVARPGSAKAEDVVQTGVVVVDLDECDVQKVRTHLTRHIGEPSLVVASGGLTADGQDKLHLYWRLDEAALGDDLERVRALRESVARKVGGDLSFQSLHQPIRVPGTVHGKNRKLAPVRMLQATGLEYCLDELEETVVAMPALQPAPTAQAVSTDRRGPRELATRVIREGGADGSTRFDALSTMIGHHVRNVRTGVLSLEEAWEAIRDYNATYISPPWEEPRLRREFDAIRSRDARNNPPGAAPAAGTGRCSATGLAEFSEDALAADFVDRHVGIWRNVGAWGSWYRWTGTQWERDEIGQSRELARQVCRDAAHHAETAHHARRIASDRTMSATLRIASTDPRIATPHGDWDVHPMLLNTPRGVFDLETGEILGHDPGLLLTQMTTASPGQISKRWTTFLSDITGGDAELQAYLARLAGYCLTGSTSEQVFAFLHGSGANGKSVFLQAISTVLGEYAATATQETFMASRSDRHLSELAGLRAARLVTVGETESGRAWAESRIKLVTGGEKIRANFMRQDFFEFTPRFKLLVAGNHLPALSGVGEAMRRRLHLVPFTVTIPPERRDRQLLARLLEEADGILGWMLEGCAEWQRRGLAPPASVTSAADAYFEEEDEVGQWIDECCATDRGVSAASRELYDSWARWANAAGMQPGSQKSLGAALKARGFRTVKLNGARGWVGIGVRRSMVEREAAE